MIQSILSFFGFSRFKTELFEIRAESSWFENLDNLAKRTQTSRASVIDSAIVLYEAALNTAHIEKSDDGLKMIITLPREQSSTEVQQENQ